MVRAVGIEQDRTVIVSRLRRRGVMADSGANACMADSEDNLVDCHDMYLVEAGLAIQVKIFQDAQMYAHGIHGDAG